MKIIELLNLVGAEVLYRDIKARCIEVDITNQKGLIKPHDRNIYEQWVNCKELVLLKRKGE